MLKNVMLAIVPLTLLATSVNADDLKIDLDSLKSADIEMIDVDSEDVTSEDGIESSEDDENAIEACFRRCGYHHRSWGCGYRTYHRCYNYCRPLYNYHTIQYCPPVCRVVATPIYHYYWGCH